MNRSTYRAFGANQDAKGQKSKQGRKRKLSHNPQLKEFVFDKLKLRWSPDQIAKELKAVYPEDKRMRISHEAIYSYIYILPRGSLVERAAFVLKDSRRNTDAERVKTSQEAMKNEVKYPK